VIQIKTRSEAGEFDEGEASSRGKVNRIVASSVMLAFAARWAMYCPETVERYLAEAGASGAFLGIGNSRC
jgi:hypothetical protein